MMLEHIVGLYSKKNNTCWKSKYIYCCLCILVLQQRSKNRPTRI